MLDAKDLPLGSNKTSGIKHYGVGTEAIAYEMLQST